MIDHLSVIEGDYLKIGMQMCTFEREEVFN